MFKRLMLIIFLYFSDPFMDLIYSILFISGLTSVLAMELCVICLNNYTGSHNRSSPLSLSIMTAFIVQMILDLILPKVVQGTQYYVAKMFIAVLVKKIIAHLFKGPFKKCLAFFWHYSGSSYPFDTSFLITLFLA